MPLTAGQSQKVWGSIFTAIAVVGTALISLISVDLSLKVWMAGAAVLGFLTGFTTGLSKEGGSGTEFVKFLGAGVLVPLLGGVAVLLARPQTVTEKSTYAGTQVVEKITTTATSTEGLLNPLFVLGSFFLFFGVAAVLGILAGVMFRASKAVPEINVAPR